MPTVNYDIARSWLREWAADNRLILDEEGEIGFGRKCVGITNGRHYVDCGGVEIEFWEMMRPLNNKNYTGYSELYEYINPRILHAPKGTPDAYHKHDCLAILGRGKGKIVQLYKWIKPIVDAGGFIETVDRKLMPYEDQTISLILHGSTKTRLTMSKYEDQERRIQEALDSITTKAQL